jgi:hypothetical protein
MWSFIAYFFSLSPVVLIQFYFSKAKTNLDASSFGSMGPSFLEATVTSGVNFVQTKIAVHENNKC